MDASREKLHDQAREAEAIEAVRSGDAGAYGYLVEKYTRRALSVAWTVVHSGADAEELVQEAFVRAYERIDRFRPGEPFGPWLLRIVTNLGLDLLRHRKRVRTEEIDERLADGRDHFGETGLSETAKRIDRALASLPPMQQLVARLSLVEEMSHEEIAAVTGVSEGTVRSHLSLARGKLKEQLKDLYEESR